MQVVNPDRSKDGGFLRRLTEHLDDEDHLKPAWLRSAFILRIVAVMVSALLVWLALTVDDANARLLLMCSVLLADGSAMLAGNTYRLRDIRRRRLKEAMTDRAQLATALQRETPQQTIRVRFGLACTGLGLGVVAVLLAIFINDADQVAQSVVIAFLIVASSLVCAIAGTLARPLD